MPTLGRKLFSCLEGLDHPVLFSVLSPYGSYDFYFDGSQVTFLSPEPNLDWQNILDDPLTGFLIRRVDWPDDHAQWSHPLPEMAQAILHGHPIVPLANTATPHLIQAPPPPSVSVQSKIITQPLADFDPADEPHPDLPASERATTSLLLIPLDPSQNTDLWIGRLELCDVAIDHPSVSRRHARITAIGQTWTLCDNNSANGCWIDGQRVTQAVLRDGDLVRFGRVLCRVRMSSPASPQNTTRILPAR